MEPLPKERSDVRLDAQALVRYAASMEPLPKERSDVQLRFKIAGQNYWASMEPLPKERSDGLRVPSGSSRARPQWSRSRRSGATEVQLVADAPR